MNEGERFSYDYPSTITDARLGPLREAKANVEKRDVSAGATMQSIQQAVSLLLQYKISSIERELLRINSGRR